MKLSKLSLFSVIMLALYLIVAGNASALELCDGFGMHWSLNSVTPDGLTGSAIVACDGQTALVTGGFRTIGGGKYFFTIYADQTANASCSEGFAFVGVYNSYANTASGNWYNSPDVAGSGTFTMGSCSEALEVSEGPAPGAVK